MLQAQEDDTHLLLEATSNQVNQDGGYTGMTPATFRDFVEDIASTVSFDIEHLILGGDHLGPNPWQHLDTATAMSKACEMVCVYAAAGFSKIHLDASMRCADDPAVLPDEVMAHRAATLCAWAEGVCEELELAPVVYIIGTEVPAPGGASHSLDGLEVTGREAIERTLKIHAEAFHAAGLDSAWKRVIAVVVQPGVEFDHDSVVDYVPAKAAHLQQFLEAHPELVMEAHSSDYQLPAAYQDLVRDGFAILKVGPALTFALREALYALAAIESEIVPEAQQSHLIKTMEATMLAHPANWQKYYHGSEHEQKLLRIYSYSDRIRYYWGFAELQESVTKLISNLNLTHIPDTILSHYLPIQYASVREGSLSRDPKALVIASIRAVLKPYSEACLG
jgi:D-tagatose-1,6-bisphosphate aldolase subunit GatZ/KbaZ